MVTVSESKPNVPSSPDLVSKIRRAGIWPDRLLDQVHAKVRSGHYPAAPNDLAKRLIKKGLLTEYQARHLLSGRPGGLAFGRYVILDRVGKGAMGKVFKARHRLMDRIVTLKFIASEYLARPNAVPRFLREMRLVGRLDHPNIVRALDADQVGGTPYIVMEYVPGEDLDRRLLGLGTLHPDEVVQYAAQTAKGLAHAHQQGIIHRDVKPSNLLLGEDGRVRLLDLGLGVLMDTNEADQGSFATVDGLGVGTIEYISPEGASGHTLDGRSDLFSLGCVMYYLMTGRVPFPGDSKVECLARRIRGRPEPIESVRPDLPSDLVEILDRLMANRPEDRFQTASETADALDALATRWRTPPPGLRSPLPAEVPSTPGHEAAVPAPSPQAESPSATSSSLFPVAAPSWWLRFLGGLAEQSPTRVLLMASAVLLGAFAVGFGLSSVLR